MHHRAFTLIELLIVIVVIAILMGLIMAGVGVARRAAMNARTQSTIGTVAAAVEQYRNLNQFYPELRRRPVTGAATPTQANRWQAAVLAETRAFGSSLLSSAVFEGEDAYAKLFLDTANPPRPLTADAMGNGTPSLGDDRWGAVNALITDQLGDAVRDIARDGVLLDAWKQPLRYRPAKYYPLLGGAAARVDGTDPPNIDSFQIWSVGADGKDAPDPGQGGDDKSNWNR